MLVTSRAHKITYSRFKEDAVADISIIGVREYICRSKGKLPKASRRCYYSIKLTIIRVVR